MFSHRRQSTSSTVPYWQTIKDENNTVDERQVRVDLAAAYRLATVFNWEEGVCNHFTVSLPGYVQLILNISIILFIIISQLFVGSDRTVGFGERRRIFFSLNDMTPSRKGYRS